MSLCFSEETYPREESLISLVDATKILATPDECVACPGVAAEALCMDCSVKLCSRCHKSHKKVPVSRSHDVRKLA